jgi:hypothetical protein
VQWTLVDSKSADAPSSASFGLTWTNEEHTRGEYGFTFGSTAGNDADRSNEWRVRGTLTAERFTPDYCGRAKWPAGSTCTILKLWPSGSAPPARIQQQLDVLGLPDRSVQTYFLFEDGRSGRFSLMRGVQGAPETAWQHVRSPS